MSKTLDNLQVGDVIECSNGKRRTILEIGPSGKTMLVSPYWRKEDPDELIKTRKTTADCWFHIEELRRNGYSVVQDEEPKKCDKCGK